MNLVQVQEVAQSRKKKKKIVEFSPLSRNIWSNTISSYQRPARSSLLCRSLNTHTIKGHREINHLSESKRVHWLWLPLRLDSTRSSHAADAEVTRAFPELFPVTIFFLASFNVNFWTIKSFEIVTNLWKLESKFVPKTKNLSIRMDVKVGRNEKLGNSG